MGTIKQILALILAAALMAGGTVRGMAAVAPCPPTAHDHSQPVQAESHAHSSHHDHGAEQAHHHPEKKQDTDHKSCLECCGICVTATNGIAITFSISIHRFVSTISYALERSVWLGQIVVIDPGIPKRIV
jgi:ABC-type Zn2+ transport system substrate-binding protein/surface adhesin